jgi:hypothetical protein
MMVSIGTISSANLLPAWAAAVRCWLSKAEAVLALARDVVARGDDVGRVDHRHPERGIGLHQLFFDDAVHVHVALNQRDRFNAGANGNRHAFVQHTASSHGDRLQARRAEAVHGRAGCRHRAARPDGSVAADVLAGGTLRQAAAHDHVFDFARLDLRARDRVLDCVTCHRGAVRVVETAPIGLCQSCARC